MVSVERLVTVLCLCSASAASLYLLHVGLNVMQNVCPLCMASHLVNFMLLWLTLVCCEQMRAYTVAPVS